MPELQISKRRKLEILPRMCASTSGECRAVVKQCAQIDKHHAKISAPTGGDPTYTDEGDHN